MSYLKYITIKTEKNEDLPSLSLNIEDSDQVDNQTILNALIGTLVKFNKNGKIEPYLCDSWSSSEDGLNWKFTVKKNYTADDGTLITPKLIKDILLQNFKKNIKKTDNTEFSKVIGWDEFLSGNENIKGIVTDESSIAFRFSNRPNDILNFLRMPYFGVWLYNDKNELVSTGAYKINRKISKNRYLLEIRKDHPGYSKESIQYLEIGTGSYDELKITNYPSIFKIVHDGSYTPNNNFKNISSPPSILQAIVINQNKKCFSNAKNKIIFHNRVAKYLKSQKNISPSGSFYLGSSRDDLLEDFSDELAYEKCEQIVSVAFQYKSAFPYINQFWQNLFDYALNGLNYEYIYPNVNDPNWVKSMINDKSIDIRTANVYAGASYSLSTIKMMFCSSLGISFPDPNNEVCNLVNHYEKNNSPIDENFKKKFNASIANNMVVIPIYHARDMWLIDSKINVDSMPTSIIYPLFENIRLNL